MNENYEIVYMDLLYILGYIKGKNENDDGTPFEGTEEDSVRVALGLIKGKIESRPMIAKG